jgi:membrane associated rhomboid family serine protease
MLSMTVIIIIITCLVSIVAFSNHKILDDLIFWPPAINNRKQYYRFFTCGLIHADFIHLGFNMYSLYIFGEYVEVKFMQLFGEQGRLFYLIMYVTALPICLLPTYMRNRDNYHYRSLGASGAVSAVVFAFIFLEPLRKLGLIFLPGLMIPGFIFGLIYLGVSTFLDRKGGGNINHSAHVWGALYGISFLIVFGNALGHYKPLHEFVEQVRYWFNSF